MNSYINDLKEILKCYHALELDKSLKGNLTENEFYNKYVSYIVDDFVEILNDLKNIGLNQLYYSISFDNNKVSIFSNFGVFSFEIRKFQDTEKLLFLVIEYTDKKSTNTTSTTTGKSELLLIFDLIYDTESKNYRWFNSEKKLITKESFKPLLAKKIRDCLEIKFNLCNSKSSI